jgi:predicted DCC family thiol-disulfide oxidoreductase YuxK
MTSSDAQMLFYDGHCGMCHAAVKFVLRHDRSGRAFRFSPLQGRTYQRMVPVQKQVAMPDSIVVLAPDGQLLVRSAAWIYILRRLGGRWAILATLIAIIPRPLRDLFYSLVARIRFYVFGRRAELFPIVSDDFRDRFDT